MYSFTNKRGKVFLADIGDIVSDENGRSGKLVSVTHDYTLDTQVLVVDPGYGIMIELVENLVNFVHTEGDSER
jgi:hypothetical protein